MPNPDRASAWKASRRGQSARVAPWACSIAFHLAAGWWAARLSWDAVEIERPRVPAVVWLRDRPITPIRREETPNEDSPLPSKTVRNASDRSAKVAPEPESVDAEAEVVGAEPEVADEIAAPTEPAEEPRSPSIVVREVDVGEATRRAVEEVSEQVARAERYRTFSLGDVTDAPPPEVYGRPSGDIFEAPSAGLTLLTPGKSGGPIGRKLTALCDVLGTLGLAVNGVAIASICVERPRYAYFAHLKPRYMLALPVCVPTPGAEAPEIDGPGDPTMKCRLVLEGELGVPADMVLEQGAAFSRE